jgi:hypothetical protein
MLIGKSTSNVANELTIKTHHVALPPSFTIIALPDTQYYSSSYPDIFTNQTQWIVANQETLNIVYVGHEGDIVNSANKITQWERASTSMSYLEDPVTTGIPDGIAYSVVRGNHDIGSLFDQYFGVARFEGRGYYGGHHANNNQNNYVLFDFGEFKYISISLDYNPTSDALNWTTQILTEYSDRRAIIISHSILDNPEGEWTTPGLNIYNTVKYHPNVFLMLCGHMHYEARRSDTFNGTIIHTLLVDYQEYPNGGNGWLRIMEIWPESNEINVKTYSPFLNQYQTDPDSEFMLFYDYDVPQSPPTITGPPKGVAEVSTEYHFNAIDPEGEQLYYYIQWDDGTNSGWFGPYASGEQINRSHTWLTTGTYTVKAKAKDGHGHESDWSTLTVRMPHHKYSLAYLLLREIIRNF